MQTTLSLLEQKFQQALQNAFPQIDPSVLSDYLVITPSTQPQFGHYQFNGAMKMVKLVQLPPRKIAEQIVVAYQTQSCMPQQVEIVAKFSIEGPGFINIELDANYLANRLVRLLREPKLDIAMPSPQRMIVEFSSPNTAKELHVGHLRSTIIGDCLARLFEFLGHDVLRLNHVGDWGTPFGMLIAYMQDTATAVLTGQKQADLTDLASWYKAAKQRFDTEPAFKLRAQQTVVALQAKNKREYDAWQIICQTSRIAYQQIYDLLDVQLVERGESFYNPYLDTLIADLTQKQIVADSDGAKCIFCAGFQSREGTDLPLIIQKSDGGYNYDTTDMAAMRHRTEVEQARRIIVVTDAGQSLHFQMITAACQKADYLDPQKVRFDHVPFGLVLRSDGKKFQTRSGETEKLIDLIQTAIEQAKSILQTRDPELDPSDLEQRGAALGIAAIKYADLSCNRISDYVFSYERMLRFEGNTAAFLMYAYVRIIGIQRKVGKSLLHLQETKLVLQHPTEITLAVQLQRFSEVLLQMAEDLLPHHLTEYLYSLAECFHAFFRDCRVDGSSEEESRLLLCYAVAAVFKQGMQILGIKLVEKM